MMRTAWYFLGAAYAQVKQFPQAIDAFQHALKLNPLHASAQFGLSRAYQQSGDLPSAREHLVRFQYITQNKLGAAISLAYGEQGKYSLAEEVVGAQEKVPEQIKVSVCGCDGLCRDRGEKQLCRISKNGSLPWSRRWYYSWSVFFRL